MKVETPSRLWTGQTIFAWQNCFFSPTS